MLRVRLLCALLVIASWLPSPARAGTNYALLIGINKYDYWGDLVNPLPDVAALDSELAQRFGFRTEVLTNPTRAQLLGKLRQYAKLKFTLDDQLLIVFAGHGNYDELTRIGYLATRDSASRTNDKTFSSLLAFPTFLALVDRLEARKVLLVVDACYSGSLADGATAPRAVAIRRDSPIRRYLTSGGVEYVPDGDPNRHSPFMRKLLTHLRGVGAEEELRLGQLEQLMTSLTPRPRFGSFGRNSGSSNGISFLGRAAARRGVPFAPSQLSVRNASISGDPPAPSAKSTPRLRARDTVLTVDRLERAFKRQGLHDVELHQEGDFPNRFSIQERGEWDVVLDMESNLMWQRGGSVRRLNPAEAAAYVAGLNRQRHAGFDNWRLPTVEELGSLLEPLALNQGLRISPDFDAEQETCWSADRDHKRRTQYYASFNIGRILPAFKKTAFVRAVRSVR